MVKASNAEAFNNAVAVRNSFLEEYGSVLVLDRDGCVTIPPELVEVGHDIEYDHKKRKTRYIAYCCRATGRRKYYLLHRILALAALPESARIALHQLGYSLDGSHLCRNKRGCIACLVLEPADLNHTRHECHDHPGHRCDHAYWTGVPCFILNNRNLDQEENVRTALQLHSIGALTEEDMAAVEASLGYV